MRSKIVNWLIFVIYVSIPIAAIASYIWYRNIGSLVVVIIILTVMAYAMLPFFRAWKEHHFDCPKCSVSFQPTFIEFFGSSHRDGHGKLKCPNCGFYGLMWALENDENHR
jgi:hypothetical protein